MRFTGQRSPMTTRAAGVLALALAQRTCEASSFFHETLQDHYDGSNDAKWQQEYFVNDTFWKGPASKAPVFVCVGGEGPPLDESITVASVHCNDAVEWLEESGALFFALQHRYYGCQSNSSACPVQYPFQSAHDMRFLSSRQALEDLALFHEHMVQAYALTPDNRWVTFGGSYPGVLAAYARSKFPHLFFAAVSSSSPVFAKLEMPGYYDYVSRAFQQTSVGGSKECRDKIALGHSRIGDILEANEPSALRDLEDKFSLAARALDTIEGKTEFAGMGVADFPAQGNDPVCTSPCCNIAKICAMVLDDDVHSDPVDTLAAVRRAQQEGGLQARPRRDEMRPLHPGSRTGASPAATAAEIGASPVNFETDIWTWQVCTEVGFLQTCNKGSECMFTQGWLTLNYTFKANCDLYGFKDIDRLSADVARFNVEYAGYRIATPRILWIGGTVDPWLALSIQHLSREQTLADQRMLLVRGASHHAWTHPSRDDDQLSVEDARTYLRHVVGKWLAEDAVATVAQQ